MANRKSPNNELPEEIGAEQSQPQDEQNPQAEEAIELNAGAVDIEQEQTVDLNVESEEGPQPQVDIPDELPILPLRGMVVYPQTTIPLTVGQPRSIRLVDEAVAGDRVIGLVASKDPELETPGPDDIYEYGTLAQIHRLFRAPDGTIRLLVQGIARIRVEEYKEPLPE